MDIVLWIIVAAALLFFSFAAIVARFYRIAFVRNEKEQPDITVIGRPWAAYLDKIKQGIDWLEKNTTDTVGITSYDGLRLSAWVVERENARGTFLMCHGYRSRGFLDFSCVFRFFHERGFNLVVIEQRACGNSEGNIITFGIKESQDVKSWAEWTKQRFGDDLPIILAGVSMGCTSALLSLAYGLPENVKGIIADCGYTSPWRQLAYILKRDYKLPPFPILYAVNWLFRRKTGVDLRQADTLPILQESKTPILFIHGGADRFVPTDFSVESWRACSADKDILIVEGASHGTSALAESELYCEKAGEFLDGLLDGQD